VLLGYQPDGGELNVFVPGDRQQWRRRQSVQENRGRTTHGVMLMLVMDGSPILMQNVRRVVVGDVAGNAPAETTYART
jgi:hypothetical protein